jgi:hypothetical protein
MLNRFTGSAGGAVDFQPPSKQAATQPPPKAQHHTLVLAMLRANGVTEPTAKQVRDLYGGVQSSLISCNGKPVALVGARPIVEPSAGW